MSNNSKIIINGTDLSGVFAPYVSGTKTITNFFVDNGTTKQDLCDIFAPYISGSKPPPTNCLVYDGTTTKDLIDIFQSKYVINSTGIVPFTYISSFSRSLSALSGAGNNVTSITSINPNLAGKTIFFSCTVTLSASFSTGNYYAMFSFRDSSGNQTYVGGAASNPIKYTTSANISTLSNLTIPNNFNRVSVQIYVNSGSSPLPTTTFTLTNCVTTIS